MFDGGDDGDGAKDTPACTTTGERGMMAAMGHGLCVCFGVCGVRLSRSRFCTPQKNKEKNSKVGDFALRNSYVKCLLKLNWHGWCGSYLSLLQLQSSPELSGAL